MSSHHGLEAFKGISVLQAPSHSSGCRSGGCTPKPRGQLCVPLADAAEPLLGDAHAAVAHPRTPQPRAPEPSHIELDAEAAHVRQGGRDSHIEGRVASPLPQAVLRHDAWRPAVRERAPAPRPTRHAALMSGGSRGERVAAHFHYVPSHTRDILRAARSGGCVAAVPEPHQSYIDPARVKEGHCIASGGQSKVFTASIRSKRSACPPTAAIKKTFRTQQDARREIAALRRLRHAGIIHLFGLLQQPPQLPPSRSANACVLRLGDHSDVGDSRGSHSDSLTASAPQPPAILMERYSCSLAQALDAAAVAGGVLEEPQSPRGANACRNTMVLSAADEMSLITCVPSALAYAHRRGIVHEDVKPDNVLLRRGRRGALVTSLADWGMAVELRGGCKGGPGAGAQMFDERLLGTPGYVAPEQLRLPFPLADSADVYSWGMVLAEMVLWTAPWIGVSEYDVALAAVRGVHVVAVHSLENCGGRGPVAQGLMRSSTHRRAMLAGHVWCTTHDPRLRPDMAAVAAAFSEIAADAAMHGGTYSVAFIETMARASRGSISYSTGRARSRQRCVAAADAAAAAAAYAGPGAHVSLPSAGLLFTGSAPVLRPATEEEVEAGVFATAAAAPSEPRSTAPLSELYRSSTDQEVATPALSDVYMHAMDAQGCADQSSWGAVEGVHYCADSDVPRSSRDLRCRGRDASARNRHDSPSSGFFLARAPQVGQDTYGESGAGPPFHPGLAFHRSSQEVPETTPSCITSIATLTDAALLPQPPTRRICKPPSHTYIPSEAALASSMTFPGSPFRGGAAQPPGGAFNSGAFNSGIFNSSVLYNSGPFGGGGHPARSSTGELYNSVALKKGVLVEFRGGSMETSEPSTRIGAARTALLPRSLGLGGSVYSADREAGSRSRGCATHNSGARRLRKSTTTPPPHASTDVKPSRKGGAFSRLSTAVAAAARARCACMGPGSTRGHKD